MSRTTAQRRAFTVIEVLLAVAIGAMLMAAVAVCMFVSARGMKSTADYAQATQTARDAVQTMSSAVRVSQVCDVDAGLAAIGSLSSNVLYVTPFAGTKVAYVYDAKQKRVLLDTAPASPPVNETVLAGIRSRASGSTPTVFALAEGVESCNFVGIYQQRNYSSPADPVIRLVNVDIKLKVKVNGETLDLAESVVPRTSYDQ